MLNKLHIGLENRMTPVELDELFSEFASDQNLSDTLQPLLKQFVQPSAQRDWVSRLKILGAKSGKDFPESFQRGRLRREVFCFGATGGKSSGKTLAICFSGHALRMMMPLPVFLQHMDSESVDVVLLRDPSKNGYRGGIYGVGDDLESSIDNLRDILKIDEYRNVVSIGTSGGGLPAVLCALRLNLDAALSVGGGHPDDPKWIMSDGTGLRGVIRNYAGQTERIPNIFLVYGAGNPKDKVSAVGLKNLIPAKVISISSAIGLIGHNALYPLLVSGKLREFLGETVFSCAKENSHPAQPIRKLTL